MYKLQCRQSRFHVALIFTGNLAIMWHGYK